jgi:hypothetical protein
MRKRRYWTAGDADALTRLYPETPMSELKRRFHRTDKHIYNKAAWLGLKRSEAYKRRHARIKSGERRGRATEFKPGHATWNKGTNFVAGGRSAETRFKPGNRPPTWQPVGTEVVDPAGYRKRKVADDRQPARRNWVFCHVALWEAHHGAVPGNHAVVFRDGDKAHIAIDNLECVDRRELMRRNSVHRLPKALADVVQLKGAVQRQIHKREE